MLTPLTQTTTSPQNLSWASQGSAQLFSPRGQRGFTLLELMVSIAVLAILITLAVPSLQQMLTRNQLKSAAQALADDLHWTRAEAIVRRSELFVTVNSGAWCYGVSTTACNCLLDAPTAVSACVLMVSGTPQLKRGSGAEYPRITIASVNLGTSSAFGFEPTRAMATPPEERSLVFASPAGEQIRVSLSPLGQVGVCSPNASVVGVAACR